MNKRKVLEHIDAFSTVLELSQTDDIEIKFSENHISIYQLSEFNSASEIVSVYILEDKFAICLDSYPGHQYFAVADELLKFSKHKEVDFSTYKANIFTNYQYATNNTDVLLEMLEVVTCGIIVQHSKFNKFVI